MKDEGFKPLMTRIPRMDLVLTGDDAVCFRGGRLATKDHNPGHAGLAQVRAM